MSYLRFIRSLASTYQAFEAYSTQNGKWPPSAANGVVPVGLRTGWLKNGVWQDKTAVGGQWNW
ncbi:MAG: hypothetical protein EBU25_08910, partial [Burkholderiaceae bacterium]|nr:hypothetical protein [Burkholderiaceae bacterium]